MKRHFRKIVAFFIAAVICFSIIPMSDLSIKASAASNNWSWPTTSTQVSGNWPNYSSGKYHGGIDFPVAVGTAVYSTCDGEVVDIQSLTTSYGKHIKIRAIVNGSTVYMRYCHLSSFAVSIGDKVSSGQLIAYSGNTGNSTGPHLHYEVRNANDYYGNSSSPNLNPRNYLPGTSFTFETNSGSSSSISFNAAVDSKIEDGSTIDKVVTPSYTVAGWAYCSDGSETTIYWCIDDGAAYVANKNNRQDVVNAHGCRLDCGFDFSVPIKDLSTGTHKLSIWVSNATQSADVFAGYFTVTSSDKTIPSVSNVGYRNYSNGFDVTCLVDDNYGVAKVIAAVWTDANGQDDLTIHDLNLNADGKSAWGFIDYTKHNSATGIYCYDIYVYDYSGNEIMTGTYSIYVGNLVQFWWLSNPDNTESWIDTSGVPTVSGIRKFWFKEWDVDTNYYLNILVDGQTVVYNSPSDANGYISYVIDTGTMTDGLHSITAVLADSNTAYTATKEFYVNNLIAFTAISSVDNNNWLDVTGTPKISGTCKIWFKKESPDTNYYIDMYVDDVRVEHNMPVDADGNYSYTIDTTTLSNGEHTFRAELFDSKSYYTATKTVIVNNGTLIFDVNTLINNEMYASGISEITFDVYLNDVLVDNDVTDFYSESIVQGTTYEIKDIKCSSGYIFTGGNTSGVINDRVEVRLNFNEVGNFDINMVVNDTVYMSGSDGFTFDLYLNGELVKDDGIDYHTSSMLKGTIYEIKDIRCPIGYVYTGGAVSGIMTDAVDARLSFSSVINVEFQSFSESPTETKTVIYGATYGTLPVPVRDGYTFDGWYTAASGGTKITDSTTVSITSDQTLYAHWTCKHELTEVKNAKSSTCTATGYTGDTYCKTCGEKIKSGTTITKLNHYYKITTTQASLTANGSIKTVCTGCGTVKSNTTISSPQTFTLSKTSYTFDGKVKTPTVTVKDAAGNTLVKDTDYTVTYDSGRINAGTYNVTVNMMGNYKGTKTLTFKINPINISTCTVKLSNTSYTYNGNVRTPTVSVVNAYGTTLKAKNYTVTYAEGRKTPGTYKVTVTMKGNYTGSKTLSFKINPIDISTCTVKLSKTSYTFDGRVKTPAVSVINAYGTTLKATNYTVKYDEGRKNAGTYNVTVTMKGNYTGSKTLSFKIKPIDISTCTVKLSKTSYTFDGRVKTPAVSVINAYGTTLKATNYTVTYSEGRKNAGTYKVTVTMKGNYTGSKALSFKINPIDISTCDVKLSNTSYTYNGNVKTPTVSVVNAYGTTLKATNYTVTYSEGRKNVGTYKVTVTMKGNYTGTKTLTFKINPPKTTVDSLVAGTKSITVNLTKQTTQTTGYQIQYSTNKDFTNAKTKTITSNSTVKTTLSSLTSGKTYYVRVRTYKTVNDVKYYSGWSASKSVKTK